MVTAVLPAMTLGSTAGEGFAPGTQSIPRTESYPPTAPQTMETPRDPPQGDIRPSVQNHSRSKPSKSRTSQIAGLVGTFTGCGALLALGVFLPLPARLSKAGQSREQAVVTSFYIVGAIAFAVAVFCFVGLRNLKTEQDKRWTNLLHRSVALEDMHSTLSRLRQGAILGFTNLPIGLGYLGGFVARASSVGISLFIPLFVNAYFIRTGLCPSGPGGDLSDVKARCRYAYTLAASLTGVSQAVALVLAPLFGWLDGRYGQYLNAPLLFAAISGVIGYTMLASLHSPQGNATVWVCMVLVGISQIGAIVCSLSSLSRGIESTADTMFKNNRPYSKVAVTTSEDEALPRYTDNDAPSEVCDPGEEDDSHPPHGNRTETSALIPVDAQASFLTGSASQQQDLRHLKGTIAGLYSLCGGAGILLLTKLGGYTFDRLSEGAPFYMLAGFNAILLVVAFICSLASLLTRQGSAPDAAH